MILSFTHQFMFIAVGIPEESGLHATSWKVLTGYLPPDKSKWQTTIQEQRLSYYVRHLI
jgi:hypothetical protein